MPSTSIGELIKVSNFLNLFEINMTAQQVHVQKCTSLRTKVNLTVMKYEKHN